MLYTFRKIQDYKHKKEVHSIFSWKLFWKLYLRASFKYKTLNSEERKQYLYHDFNYQLITASLVM